MNTTTKTILSLTLVILAIVGLVIVLRWNPESSQPIVQEPVTNTIVQNADMTVTNLSANQTITLPMTFTGDVVGNWFFEGSFPVFLKDAAGVTIATGLASSTEDWMTTNRIPFTVTLPAVNYQGTASIVFQKDNPSGEPQFDANLIVPVVIQ